MRRHKPKSRRQVRSSDSSDDSDGEVEPKKAMRLTPDPKIALSISDLGKDSRDRNTAHDLERDREIDHALLSRSRKCNQGGTEEAKEAAQNQQSLEGWANFGGKDSTTNLDDIAGGQYHRLATSQKVQAEIQHLHLQGKEISAEAIDDFRNVLPRHVSSRTGADNPVRRQFSANVQVAPRPLDPAVDPDRAYTYKLSKKGGKHGAQVIGRAGAHTSLNRPSPARLPQRPKAALGRSKTANVNNQAIHQRKIQDRPRPPVVLAGNPEPHSIPPTIEATPQPTSPFSVPTTTAGARPLVARFPTQINNTIVTDSFSDSKIFPFTAPTSLSTITSPLQKEFVSSSKSVVSVPQNNNSSASMPLLADPQGFMNWASHVGTQQFPQPISENEPEAKPPPGDVVKADVRPITIPRTELALHVPSASLSHDDSHTDGLLSPVTVSNVSNQESIAASEAVASEPAAVPSTSPVEPIPEVNLIDIDSQAEQAELIRPLSPQTITSAEGRRYVLVPEEFTLGVTTDEQIAEFIAALRLQSGARTVVGSENETAEISDDIRDPIAAPGNQNRPNPFDDPDAPNRVLSLDERIVDAINPGFRQRMAGKHLSEMSAIGSVSKPLHSLSSNISSNKGQVKSKWEKQNSHLAGKGMSKTDIIRQVDSTLKDITSSMLGDSSTRPPSHAQTEWRFAPTPIKSKWGDNSKSARRIGIERTASGQGHDQVMKDFVAGSVAETPTSRSGSTLFPQASSHYRTNSDSDGSEL